MKILASSNPDSNLEDYMSNIAEAEHKAAQDTAVVNDIAKDITTFIDSMIPRIEGLIADRLEPMEEFEISAVDETHFYDSYNDDGDLNDAWNKYDNMCKLNTRHQNDTDYLSKVLEALRSIG